MQGVSTCATQAQLGHMARHKRENRKDAPEVGAGTGGGGGTNR